MSTLVIVNPNASAGRTGRRWSSIEAEVRRRLGAFEVVLTRAPGDAIQIARQAAIVGVSRLVVMGGDGTINEAVNGLFDQRRPINSKTSLGLLPSGTGGDFRKSLGIGAALSPALDVLERNRIRTIDLGYLSFEGGGGQTQTRYFCNIASFGMSGQIMLQVNGPSLLKRVNGKLAFYWATVRALLTWKNAPVSLRIFGQEPQVHELQVNTVHICNGRFSGGGMLFAPDADLDDGLFDVVVMGDFSIRHLLKSFSLLYSGAHIDHPLVKVFRTSKVEARGDTTFCLEVDGETPGQLPATFEVIPGALPMIC